MHIANVLLFPGQGSQEPGMGRALAERSGEAMDLWKKAEKLSGLPLRGIYWEGGDGDMADTRALQPALTAANLGFWLELSRRFKPDCAAGHSLGEYSALAASGALDADSVLGLVSLRGRLMAEADPVGRGAMSAVLKLDEAGVNALVESAKQKSGKEILVANYNTPGQFVVSGDKEAIAALEEEARGLKARAVRLAVSGAFHSPLMAGAAAELNKALDKANWSRPRFPVYCNVHGRPAAEAGELKELLKRQMTSSVRWISTIRNQYADGARRFVECGPKAVLSRMVGPILSGLAEESAYSVASVGSLEQLDSFA